MGTPDDDRLRSLSELAEHFGYADSSTLRAAAIAGALRAEKIGKQWVSTIAWVQAWHAQAGVGGKPRGRRTGGE